MDLVSVPAETKRPLFTACTAVSAQDPFDYLAVPAPEGPFDGFDVAAVIASAADYRDSFELSLDDIGPVTFGRRTAGDLVAILGIAIGSYCDDVASDPVVADLVASWRAAASTLIASAEADV